MSVTPAAAGDADELGDGGLAEVEVGEDDVLVRGARTPPRGWTRSSSCPRRHGARHRERDGSSSAVEDLGDVRGEELVSSLKRSPCRPTPTRPERRGSDSIVASTGRPSASSTSLSRADAGVEELPRADDQERDDQADRGAEHRVLHRFGDVLAARSASLTNRVSRRFRVSSTWSCCSCGSSRRSCRSRSRQRLVIASRSHGPSPELAMSGSGGDTFTAGTALTARPAVLEVVDVVRDVAGVAVRAGRATPGPPPARRARSCRGPVSSTRFARRSPDAGRIDVRRPDPEDLREKVEVVEQDAGRGLVVRPSGLADDVHRDDTDEDDARRSGPPSA